MPTTRNANALGEAEGASSTPVNKRRKIASQPTSAAAAAADSSTEHDATVTSPLRSNLRRRNAALAPASKAGESSTKETTRAKRRSSSETPGRGASASAAASAAATSNRRSASRALAAGTPPTLQACAASNGTATTTPKRVLAPDSSPPPSPAPASSSRAASPDEDAPSHDGDVHMREADAGLQDADVTAQQSADDEEDDDDDDFGPTQASVGEASNSQPRFVPLFPIRASPAPAPQHQLQRSSGARLERVEEQSEPPSASANAREEAEAEEALVSLEEATTRKADEQALEVESAAAASGEKVSSGQVEGTDAQHASPEAAKAQDAPSSERIHAPPQQQHAQSSTGAATEQPNEPPAAPAVEAAAPSPPQVVVQQASEAAASATSQPHPSPAPAGEAPALNQDAVQPSSSLSDAPLPSSSTEKESSDAVVEDAVVREAGEAQRVVHVEQDGSADVEMADAAADAIAQVQERGEGSQLAVGGAPLAAEALRQPSTPAAAARAPSSSASAVAAPVVQQAGEPSASPPAASASSAQAQALALAAPVAAVDATSDLTAVSEASLHSANNSQGSSKPEAIKQAFLLKTPSPVEPIVIAPAQSSLAPPAENGGMFSSSAEVGCGSSALQGVFSGEANSVPAAAGASSSSAELDLDAELLDGLGSQDFDDLDLSPQMPARGLAVPTRPDSPSAKAREFRRSRSNRAAVGQGLSAMGPPPVAAARSAKGKGKQPQLDDSDDEFDDPLFADLTDADLDVDESWTGSSFAPQLGKSGAPPEMVTFATAGSKPWKMPNAAALEAARAKLGLDDNDADDSPSATPSRTSSPAVGFAAASTSRQAAAAGASQAVPARMRTPLGKPNFTAAAASQRSSVGKQQGFVRPGSAAGNHESSTVRQVSTPQPPARQALASPATAIAAPVFATPVPRRPAALAASVTRPQSLNAKPSGLSRGFNAPHSTPLTRATQGSVTTPRVQLGQATRSASRGRATPKFTTPFKNGAQPGGAVADTQESPAGRRTLYAARVTPSKPSPASQGATRDKFAVPVANARPSGSVVGSERSGSGSRLRTTSSGGKAVFDLSRPRTERKGMAAYGLRPESVSAATVREQSEEIPVILNDPAQAAHYEFDDGQDGSLFGPAQALQHLLEHGAEHADLRWVKNHWCLILWKLAALTRLRLEEFDWRFSSQEVCRQLLYRYEREVNQAQRSAIKRIQEQDSSPAQPMVLCVSEVPKIFEDDEQPFLELTDGWYRIRASLDATLTRAVHRGRIKLGSKLAISAAKRVGTPDATEVLQALEVSALSIEGNATSLARWDARLGFSPRPFVATLRSLTADGGTIPLMDIIITRIHPIGFQSAEREAEGEGEATRNVQQEAWCEADEVAKQDEWEKKRAEVTARIEAQFEARARTLDNVVSLLQERSHGVVADSSQSYAGATQNDISLDTLLDSTNPRAALARIPPRLLPSLATLALARRTHAEEEARQAAESEIARACPPRRSRDFCVVRFEDAGLPEADDGWGGRKERSKRSVQLTVWDVRKLGEDGLQEGKRYTVTNLIPIKRMAWRPKDQASEIYLSTRRDSRWRRVN